MRLLRAHSEIGTEGWPLSQKALAAIYLQVLQRVKGHSRRLHQVFSPWAETLVHVWLSISLYQARRCMELPV